MPRCILALVLAAAVAPVSQEKPPCLFNGAINDVKVKSFEGRIAHGSGPSDLFLIIDYSGSLWMMYLTGVTNVPGSTRMKLVMKRHDGETSVEHFAGSGLQNMFNNPKDPRIFGFIEAFS
jgi:hypothetical protein